MVNIQLLAVIINITFVHYDTLETVSNQVCTRQGEFKETFPGSTICMSPSGSGNTSLLKFHGRTRALTHTTQTARMWSLGHRQREKARPRHKVSRW